jgi:hypothetical protein
MPRDAYISYQGHVILFTFCHFHNIFSRILLERPLQGEMLFYSSLFQAGLDRVVTVEEDGTHVFGAPSRRIKVFSLADRDLIRDSVNSYFDSYLGSNWLKEEKPEGTGIFRLREFLCDLLISYRLRRPLLAPLSIPSLAELSAFLPLEIFVPIEKLFKSITAYESVVAVPNMRVSREQLSIIDEILTSDDYGRVETAHAELLGSASRESCLIELEKASTALYWRWKDLLRIKSSVIRVINGIPAFIENFSGKAVSSVAALISTGLAERMAKDDSLVIYDASSVLHGLSESLMRQVAASPIDEATIKSRMEQHQEWSSLSSLIEAYAEKARRKAKVTEWPASALGKDGSRSDE